MLPLQEACVSKHLPHIEHQSVRIQHDVSLEGKNLHLVKAGGKKRKKRDDANDEVAGDAVNEGERLDSRRSIKQRSELGVSEGINNSSTASLTAKVLQEQELAKKRRLENSNVRSLFSSRDQNKPHGKSADFMTRGYSVR